MPLSLGELVERIGQVNASHPLPTTVLAAVLLAGGSLLHCSLMCGPIATATMGRSQNKSERKWRFLQYQFGRSIAYAGAGFAAASVGHVIRPSPLAVAVFLAMVVTLVLVQLFQITVPTFKSSFTTNLYGQLARPFRRMGRFQSFGLGLLTPLIPCGQLWMVLGFSALSTSGIEGAGLAFAFSVFSAPGVYGFSFLKERILALSLRQPQLVKVGLRSALVFILALSAVKYSTLIARTNQAEAKGSSLTVPEAGPVCH